MFIFTQNEKHQRIFDTDTGLLYEAGMTQYEYAENHFAVLIDTPVQGTNDSTGAIGYSKGEARDFWQQLASAQLPDVARKMREFADVQLCRVVVRTNDGEVLLGDNSGMSEKEAREYAAQIQADSPVFVDVIVEQDPDPETERV